MSKVLDEVSGRSFSARETTRLEFLHRSVLQVVHSPDVVSFVVGITANAESRRRAYFRLDGTEWRLGGFAVLEWGKTAEQVLDFECWLFNRLVSHRKYERTTTRRYYRSGARHLDDQVLYLAWWTPAEGS